ncbi:hypothetical protein EDB92DRAFT_116550 [Lactarius akahatsu]|uniref:Secreted protein n=1 Tax=Lactarius akahatsu TaxID=416441 RepID=A0AAD4QAC6_9AGAM|nr:hypothetical protein EDB92DRAFT_116550 [Lactarius akahatsu]
MSCRVCVVLILYVYVCDGTIDGCNARISGSVHAGIDKKGRDNGLLGASSMRIPGPCYSKKVAMGNMRETYACEKEERRKTNSNGFTRTHYPKPIRERPGKHDAT